MAMTELEALKVLARSRLATVERVDREKAAERLGEVGGFLTVAEFAAAARVHENTVRNWIDAGTLKAYKAGAGVRIPLDEFRAFMREKQIRGRRHGGARRQVRG